jgi:hypothetical protein
VDLPSDVSDELLPEHVPNDDSEAAPVVMKRPAGKRSRLTPIIKQPANAEYIKTMVGQPNMPLWLRQHLLGLPPSTCPQYDHFMEIYSPPRVMPWIHKQGLRGQRSMDKMNGWDLCIKATVQAAFEELHNRKPYVIMLSPPCTAYSVMMNVNWPKMAQEVAKAKAAEAIWMLDVAAWFMEEQISAGRKFIFEHPAGAKSWGRPNIKAIAKHPTVFQRTFDQCMYGMVSKVTKTPMQKKTMFMSNMPTVMQEFSGQSCSGNHAHIQIQGSEGGEKRTTWSQRYPDLLCMAIANCTQQQVQLDNIP